LFAQMMAEATAAPGYAATMADTSRMSKLGDEAGEAGVSVDTDPGLSELKQVDSLDLALGAQPEPDASRTTLSHEERILRAMLLYEKRNDIIKETGKDIAGDDDLMDAHDDFEEETISLGVLGTDFGLHGRTDAVDVAA